jgi:hypothetical protein
MADEISLSRNFAKYLFRISQNNFFYFAKFRIVKYYEIWQNIAKYSKISVMKLKFLQGKTHFLILLHFNTTKKITFKSKIHKHLYISISVVLGTDPMIRIHVKISRIRNTGKTFKKCWLKLILYVLNLKNLHNETISWNNLYKILRNLAKCTGIWKIYITKQSCEISWKKLQRNFAKLKSLLSLFCISRNKKNPISRPP